MLLESNAYLLLYDILLKTFCLKEYKGKEYIGPAINSYKNWELKNKRRQYRFIEIFGEATTNPLYFYNLQLEARKEDVFEVEIDDLALILALEYTEGVKPSQIGYKDWRYKRAKLLWSQFTDKYVSVLGSIPIDTSCKIVGSRKAHLEKLLGAFNGYIIQGECKDDCKIRFQLKDGKTKRDKEPYGTMNVRYEQDHPDTPVESNFFLSLIFCYAQHITLSYCNVRGSDIQHGALHLKLSEDGTLLHGNFMGYFEKKVPPRRKACEGSIVLQREKIRDLQVA